jgi:hypothetical protein
MASIEISDELFQRVREFQAVLTALADKDITAEACTELILQQGLDSMLANLFGPQGAGAMLQTIQQLSVKYPKEVYQFIAEIINAGESEIEKERVKNELGFHSPAA